MTTSGMTLVELLVAMVLVSVLGAIVSAAVLMSHKQVRISDDEATGLPTPGLWSSGWAATFGCPAALMPAQQVATLCSGSTTTPTTSEAQPCSRRRSSPGRLWTTARVSNSTPCGRRRGAGADASPNLGEQPGLLLSDSAQ